MELLKEMKSVMEAILAIKLAKVYMQLRKSISVSLFACH